MDEPFYYEEIHEVFENCVVPSLYGISRQIFGIASINLIFNFSTQTVRIPKVAFHVISFTLGLLLFYSIIIQANIWHFLVFLMSSYGCVYITHRAHINKWTNVEYIIGSACIGYLLLCEFVYPYQEEWMQSRGLFMVAAMKIISLSSDLQHGLVMPSIIEYLGYTCSPANSIFGPWISFKEYNSIRDGPRNKNINWMKRILVTLSVSLFFLTVSNCWGTYFVPDGYSKWFVAYRQALSFRTSHYFISYLSEAAMVIAGYNDDKVAPNEWGYPITDPLDIEVPSSLVSVVVSWNVPMHRFLKKYVYKVSLQFGTFKAILITYLVSSLLHGFNIEIAAVLLTIGLYSYIQLKFQEKLSSEFNACLRVRPCKHCNHKHTKNSIIVKLLHVIFSSLTIFNLIYLGVLMDGVSDSDSLSIYAKWENLDFLSNWIMLALHIYTIL